MINHDDNSDDDHHHHGDGRFCVCKKFATTLKVTFGAIAIPVLRVQFITLLIITVIVVVVVIVINNMINMNMILIINLIS